MKTNGAGNMDTKDKDRDRTRVKCFNCNKFGGENAKEYIKRRKRKWDRRRQSQEYLLKCVKELNCVKYLLQMSKDQSDPCSMRLCNQKR